jgi:hypothetical protein
MDLSKLSLGDKIVGACGIVLLIALLFLPWHQLCVDFGAFGGETCDSASALGDPGGFWGILALLLTLAVVGVLIADRLAGASLPELPIPWHQAIFYACIGVLVILLLKLVTETDFLAWGAWVAILVSAGMAYGGFLIFKDEGSGASAGGGGTAPPQPF